MCWVWEIGSFNKRNGILHQLRSTSSSIPLFLSLTERLCWKILHFYSERWFFLLLSFFLFGYFGHWHLNFLKFLLLISKLVRKYIFRWIKTFSINGIWSNRKNVDVLYFDISKVYKKTLSNLFLQKIFFLLPSSCGFHLLYNSRNSHIDRRVSHDMSSLDFVFKWHWTSSIPSLSNFCS